MPDFRVYSQTAEPASTVITLTADESHHLVVVNRCQRGDPVVVFDGRGREWITRCTEPVKQAAVLSVSEFRQATTLPHAITLAQALPKGGTMDEIVRQATEVGAARIVPLTSERTQVHLEGDRADKKIDKWRVTSVEAAKQCGNPWLPEITPLQTLAQFLAASAETDDLKFIASLHPGAISLKSALAPRGTDHAVSTPRRAIWLVGPEGDFSPAEISTALAAGFQPITLGPLVLRSDTAALYALSILTHELQSR
jgi:16S rRNA (uracil1498-N3)-methyltransferase